jgi:hypothetical protein
MSGCSAPARTCRTLVILGGVYLAAEDVGGSKVNIPLENYLWDPGVHAALKQHRALVGVPPWLPFRRAAGARSAGGRRAELLLALAVNQVTTCQRRFIP